MGWMPIGNFAHGAGALVGGLLGMCFSPLTRIRLAGLSGLTASLLLIAALATSGRPYVNTSKQRALEIAYDGYRALLLDDPQRAAQLLEQAVELAPGIAHAWQNLGLAYDRLGRRAEAIRAYTRAEELSDTVPLDEATRRGGR
jgi:tetratricopeptide (TPR) repeat protein